MISNVDVIEKDGKIQQTQKYVFLRKFWPCERISPHISKIESHSRNRKPNRTAQKTQIQNHYLSYEIFGFSCSERKLLYVCAADVEWVEMLWRTDLSRNAINIFILSFFSYNDRDDDDDDDDDVRTLHTRFHVKSYRFFGKNVCSIRNEEWCVFTKKRMIVSRNQTPEMFYDQSSLRIACRSTCFFFVCVYLFAIGLFTILVWSSDGTH